MVYANVTGPMGWKIQIDDLRNQSHVQTTPTGVLPEGVLASFRGLDYGKHNLFVVARPATNGTFSSFTLSSAQIQVGTGAIG